MTTTATPETTRALRTIWAELLGLPNQEAVRTDESFLRAGGDSVLAVRLAAAMRRSLGVRLALAEVTVDSTFDGLAALVDRRAGDAPHTSDLLPVELRHRVDRGTSPHVHPRGAMLDRLAANPLVVELDRPEHLSHQEAR